MLSRKHHICNILLWLTDCFTTQINICIFRDFSKKKRRRKISKIRVLSFYERPQTGTFVNYPSGSSRMTFLKANFYFEHRLNAQIMVLRLFCIPLTKSMIIYGTEYHWQWFSQTHAETKKAISFVCQFGSLGFIGLQQIVFEIIIR